MVVVDYYSNFIEVERITNMASRPVIQALKVAFGRHGIPDSVVSDNGPAFASDEFKKNLQHSGNPNTLLLPFTTPK